MGARMVSLWACFYQFLNMGLDLSGIATFKTIDKLCKNTSIIMTLFEELPIKPLNSLDVFKRWEA